MIKKALLLIIGIMFLLSFTGCSKQVEVKYGSKAVCTDCDRVVQSSVKKIQVREAEADNWKVRTDEVLCQDCGEKKAKLRKARKKRQNCRIIRGRRFYVSKIKNQRSKIKMTNKNAKLNLHEQNFGYARIRCLRV